jgi:hypothetical protein
VRIASGISHLGLTGWYNRTASIQSGALVPLPKHTRIFELKKWRTKRCKRDLRCLAIRNKMGHVHRRRHYGWLVEVVRSLLDEKDLESRVGSRKSTGGDTSYRRLGPVHTNGI